MVLTYSVTTSRGEFDRAYDEVVNAEVIAMTIMSTVIELVGFGLRVIVDGWVLAS